MFDKEEARRKIISLSNNVRKLSESASRDINRESRQENFLAESGATITRKTKSTFDRASRVKKGKKNYNVPARYSPPRLV